MKVHLGEFKSVYTKYIHSYALNLLFQSKSSSRYRTHLKHGLVYICRCNRAHCRYVYLMLTSEYTENMSLTRLRKQLSHMKKAALHK